MRANRPEHNGDDHIADKPVVEVTGLQKWFAGFHVLKDINLSIHRGEVVCIVGASGAGKSTFLRTINHLESFDEGRILVNGELVGYREKNGRLVEQKEIHIAGHRRDIGMVFQDFNLFWHMTLLDNVTLGPRTVLGYPRKEAEDWARELLNRVGLGEKVKSYPQALSGGQKQRGAIARALAMKPHLMLFDEPTSALDPDMSREVVATVESLAREGMTMIIVSHEMSFVQRAATRVVMMADGRITEDVKIGESDDMSQAEGIREYLQNTL